MKATEAKRLNELEAGQSDAQGVSRGKLLTPERRRRAVFAQQDRFRVSQCCACGMA